MHLMKFVKVGMVTDRNLVIPYVNCQLQTP
jgi:hypothetical protein